MTEPRPFANILSDTYCPEDQAIGCDSCQGDADCLIRAHDEEKCWELPNFGLSCEICDKHDTEMGGGRMKGRFPEFKIVKEAQPHCPVCKERLTGNNSIALPFRCSCGVWRPNYANQPIDFTVEPS